MTRLALGRIEFGGPDLAPRRLRDLLQAHIDASPPGSRIDWATYYFRDRALAEALIRAHRRGVTVNLVVEPKPRQAGANDAVIALLRADLGERLRLYAPTGRGRLHTKIYGFSSPDVTWVGSFNPSGDEPEDSELIAEIGDQDRGHNLLLGIERPKLTAALRAQVARLGRPPMLRVLTGLRGLFAVRDGDTSLYFYPRPRKSVAEPPVARLKSGDRLRGAISHLKAGAMTKALMQAARRRAEIELLVHDTERRVPSPLVAELEDSGIVIRRVRNPDHLPMHSKFLLVDDASGSKAWLGSFNFNPKSRSRNAELLVRTEDPQTIAALVVRFEQIAESAI